MQVVNSHNISNTDTFSCFILVRTLPPECFHKVFLTDVRRVLDLIVVVLR